MVLREAWLRWCTTDSVRQVALIRPGCAGPPSPLGKALFLLFLVTLPDEVAVHEQDVEDIPVIAAVDQTAVVQDGAVGAVLLDQAEGDIVVGAVLLGPDAPLHGLALVRVDEVAEAVVGEGQEILQVGAAGEADHLLVGEEQLVVDPVGLVDEEGAGEMLGDVLQGKAQVGADAELLYIDDLFKTGRSFDSRSPRPTTADVNVAFEILNYRYTAKLPTIVSSECVLDDLIQIDESLAGRIAERAKNLFELGPDRGKNYRLRG